MLKRLLSQAGVSNNQGNREGEKPELSIRDKIHNNLIRRRISNESDYYSMSSESCSSNNLYNFNELHDNDDNDDDNDKEIIDKYLEQQNEKFNQLISKNLNYVKTSNLNNVYKLETMDYKIHELLDKLDDSSKFQVYLTLQKQFNNPNDYYVSSNTSNSSSQVSERHINRNVNHLPGGGIYSGNVNNLTIVEKIEILILLIIRINFLIIKYSLPILKLLYNKFINNQLILINVNNFNKLLNILINFINNFDGHNNFDENVDGSNEINGRRLQAYQNNQLDRQINQFNQQMNEFDNIKFERPSLWKLINSYYKFDVSIFNAAEEFVNQM